VSGRPRGSPSPSPSPSLLCALVCGMIAAVLAVCGAARAGFDELRRPRPKAAVIYSPVRSVHWIEDAVASSERPSVVRVVAPRDGEVEELCRQVWAAEFSIRMKAARRLVELGPAAKSAIPVLTKVLNRKGDGQVGEIAAEAMGKMGVEAVAPLREILRNGYKVRFVARALGEIGAASAPAVPELIHALKGAKTHRDRAILAQALSQIGPAAKPAIPVMIEAMDSSSETAGSPTMPGPIATAVGSFDEAAVPLLLKALESEKRNLRIASAKALVAMGPRARGAIPALLEKLGDSSPETVDVRRALGKIGADALPFLRRIAVTPEEPALKRIGAMAAIGEMGPAAAAAVPDLITLLRHPELQMSAAEALGRIGAAAGEAVPDLLALKQETQHSYIRQIVSQALVGIDTPEARKATRFFRFRTALSDRYFSVFALLLYFPPVVFVVPLSLFIVSRMKRRKGEKRRRRSSLWIPIFIWTAYGIYECYMTFVWAPTVVAPIRVDLLLIYPLLGLCLVLGIGPWLTEVARTRGRKGIESPSS
jgi:HEAT repeat protein